MTRSIRKPCRICGGGWMIKKGVLVGWHAQTFGIPRGDLGGGGGGGGGVLGGGGRAAGVQAGKDVYVEKPLSHCLSEGRRVVQVAQRTGRMCQHGSQMRSNSGIIEALKFVQGGALGKIKVSRALCYKPRTSIGQINEPARP